MASILEDKIHIAKDDATLNNNNIESKSKLNQLWREKRINLNQSLILQTTLKYKSKTKP